MFTNRKPFTKISKILSLIALMAVAISCSNDDEPEPNNLDNAALSLAESTQILEVPEAMLQSDDPYAQQVAGMISMANGMGSSLALFTPPAGATHTNDIITPVNGRTAATRAVVYKWSDPQYGSVAYQIQDVSDKYIFELFYKGADDAGWYRYLYAEEMKDRSTGYMAMYDAWGNESETRDAELFRWEWSREKDNFSFSMSAGENGTLFTATVNTKTKAGAMQFYDGPVMYSEITWTGAGTGTWKHFDSEGNVVESGEWTA